MKAPYKAVARNVIPNVSRSARTLAGMAAILPRMKEPRVTHPRRAYHASSIRGSKPERRGSERCAVLLGAQQNAAGAWSAAWAHLGARHGVAGQGEGGSCIRR